MNNLPTLARDAAYVGVGFGAIAFQRAQVARHDLRVNLDKARHEARVSASGLNEVVTDQVKLVEEHVSALRADVKDLVAGAEEYLSKAAGSAKQGLDNVAAKLPVAPKGFGPPPRSQASPKA